MDGKEIRKVEVSGDERRERRHIPSCHTVYFSPRGCGRKWRGILGFLFGVANVLPNYAKQ